MQACVGLTPLVSDGDGTVINIESESDRVRVGTTRGGEASGGDGEQELSWGTIVGNGGAESVVGAKGPVCGEWLCGSRCFVSWCELGEGELFGVCRRADAMRQDGGLPAGSPLVLSEILVQSAALDGRTRVAGLGHSGPLGPGGSGWWALVRRGALLTVCPSLPFSAPGSGLT